MWADFASERGVEARQTHLDSDARIAREGAGRTPFLSAKGREENLFFVREGPRRFTKKTFFVHEGPRRTTKKTFFCPRRGAKKTFFVHEGPRRTTKKTFFLSAKGREENLFLSTEGRGGARRTPFLSAKGRGGAGRTGQLHLSSDATIAREGRPQGAPLPIVFSRRYALGRVPTRGGPTDSGSLTWVCPNLMQLPWGGGFPVHGG